MTATFSETKLAPQKCLPSTSRMLAIQGSGVASGWPRTIRFSKWTMVAVLASTVAVLAMALTDDDKATISSATSFMVVKVVDECNKLLIIFYIKKVRIKLRGAGTPSTPGIRVLLGHTTSPPYRGSTDTTPSSPSFDGRANGRTTIHHEVYPTCWQDTLIGCVHPMALLPPPCHQAQAMHASLLADGGTNHGRAGCIPGTIHPTPNGRPVVVVHTSLSFL